MISATLTITLDKPFGNLRRSATVLIAVRDRDGRWIFGGKRGHYPEGICRLIGGGVNQGEAPAESAAREMQEEMGITVRAGELTPLGQITTITHTPQQTYQMTAHLFFFDLGERIITASDDLSHFVTLDQAGFRQLIENYYNIPADLTHRSGDYVFYWRDYGKVYGEIHRLVFEELKQRGCV